METTDELLHQAEFGDLRPQFNPRAVSARCLTAEQARLIEPILLKRFMPFACPIADSRLQAEGRLRVADIGSFFYLVETLERVNRPRLMDTLHIFLDEFAQLEPRSYDQLYLWSIVQLSRSEPHHIENYWPMVITLDMQYRAEEWQRPAGSTAIDRPYRLLELICYFYGWYTLHRRAPYPSPRRYPSLATCLRRIYPVLPASQQTFLCDTLRGMAQQEIGNPRTRVAISDALGLLLKGNQTGSAPEARISIRRMGAASNFVVESEVREGSPPDLFD